MLQEALDQYRHRAEKHLAAFLFSKRRMIHAIDPALVPILDAAADFIIRKGSKRVRGFLVTIGYQLFGKQKAKDVEELSMVAELFHASLLVHDDIIDRDERRRGGKTVHAALRSQSPDRRDADHYGVSQAILAGSLLGIWARQIVLRGPWSDAVKCRALLKLEAMMEETHYGEMLDVVLAARSSATEKEIITVHVLKTAKYTFEAPLHLGAILAGATRADLAVLTDYAVPLGIAFQIQDDILGLFGSERRIGKSVTSDLAEHKKTLLFQYALRHGSLADRRALTTLLRRPVTLATLRRVRTIVRNSGALEASQTLAAALAAQATTALTRARRFDTKGSTLLRDMTSFVIHRQS